MVVRLAVAGGGGSDQRRGESGHGWAWGEEVGKCEIGRRG